MLHDALGFWPSRDNVWTNSSVLAGSTTTTTTTMRSAVGHRRMNEPMVETETLLALLAGGPYGVADKAGSINRSLALRTYSSERFTANCIMIDHFSAFEFELVALFLTLPLKNGWQWVKTARNLNLGVSRNRFCDFLADPDSRSFSRFGAIIMQVAVSDKLAR
jgi:hypothetical protein